MISESQGLDLRANSARFLFPSGSSCSGRVANLETRMAKMRKAFAKSHSLKDYNWSGFNVAKLCETRIRETPMVQSSSGVKFGFTEKGGLFHHPEMWGRRRQPLAVAAFPYHGAPTRTHLEQLRAFRGCGMTVTAWPCALSWYSGWTCALLFTKEESIAFEFDQAVLGVDDEEQELLISISQGPSADEPRRIYADWLDRQGHGAEARSLRDFMELIRHPGGFP